MDMETVQKIEITPEAVQALVNTFQPYVDAIQNTWNAIVEWMREFIQEVKRGLFYAMMIDRRVPAWLARWIAWICPMQLIR